MRTPTPDVKFGFESPCAVLPNCVCALRHALVSTVASPPPPAVGPVAASDPSAPLDAFVVLDPSDPMMAPSAERMPAIDRVGSSAGLEGE